MNEDCRIYTDYSITLPPEHPGEDWTRFVCISDTHSKTNLGIPPGDVLLHGGDLSSRATYGDLHETIDWLASLPHELKIIIAGNHDILLDNAWRKVGFRHSSEFDKACAMIRSDDIRKAGLIYLERESFEINLSNNLSWRVYGSPAAPIHLQGAFQYSTSEDAEKEWSKLDQNAEILLTHTPPYGILDATHRGKNVGCPVLLTQLEKMKQCRLHIFGHIHESHGALLTQRSAVDSSSDLVSVNAALTSHKPLPIIVDLRKAPPTA